MAELSKVGKTGPRTNIAAKFQNGPDTLPPIGVFWDIENCQVPKGKSVTALVRSIREKFFHGHREAEFLCVCDINKENKDVIHELNLAQVTVVHINATSKNAADDKLKQCMRRFVDIHGMPATILLISGDVNFATHLSDFRHRDYIYIKLVHTNQTPEPLLVCAHELYSFHELIMNLPPRTSLKGSCNRCELVVSDLPAKRDPKQIQSRLRQLSDNCGGKVINVSGSTARIRFPSAEAAQRAKKRMDREDVFGRKISVSYFHPSTSGEECPDVPVKSYQSGQKKYKNTRRQCPSSSSSCNSSPVSQGGECGKSVIPIEHFDFPPPPDLSSDDCPTQKTKHKYLAAHHSSRQTEEDRSHKLSWYQQSKESSPVPQQERDMDMGSKPLPQKNVGRVSPFVMLDGSTKANYQFTSISRPSPSYGQRNSISTTAGSYSGPVSSPYHLSRISPGSSMFFTPLSTGTEHQNQVCWSSPTSLLLGETVHPIGRASPIVPQCPSPVEMLVTNLDQSFEANEMKKILLSVFREHVMVLHISMLLQPDGSLKAVVKVPSLQDAQYAISQLHRRKIGYKRLLISYVSADRAPPLHVLRSEAVALLSDIPSKGLPLFKFRELYEKRYHRSITMSDMYKMKEAISIVDSNSGRLVCLNADFRSTPSPTDSEGSHEVQQILEKPYCEHHFQAAESQGWAEQISVYPLPNVHISLKTLAPRVHTLLDTHQGSLPLNSFCSCYKAEFGPLPVAEPLENRYPSQRGSANTVSDLYTDDAREERHLESDGMPNIQKGVPLEHLIACIPGVQITKSVLAIKKIQWLENKPADQELRSISPALAGQLTLFCRETIDLLKSQVRCSIPFNKFIPSYHHHFGRQCRVADYGFIKLIDLLEAIPHSIQILGQGQNRVLTLTHRAQVKRFAADLLRILKSRASKQVTLSELPAIYEQCLNKPFDIYDYGVCEVTDMLAEISENAIVITSSADDTVIGIPKREQTPEEIERTKRFASEVLELLQHTPNCSMPFSKFIPSYHHHFNKQCRVADYGFSKLIELLEIIPDVLEVSGIGEDKVLHLVEQEKLKVLAERLVSIIRSSPQQPVPLNSLFSTYAHQHGSMLRCEDFGASDISELISKLKNTLKLQTVGDKPVVTIVDHGFNHIVALRVKRLLMENIDGKEDITELQKKYKERFESQINILSMQKDLEDVQVQDNTVKLSPLLLLCRDILVLLHEHGGQLPLANFEMLFLQRFSKPCSSSQYGFPSMATMLQSQPDYFLIRGRRSKRVVIINKETAGSPLPETVTSHISDNCENKPIQSEDDQAKSSQTKTSVINDVPTEDLLGEPIPSGVPSPEIQPEKQCFPDKDLMGFESPLPSAPDVITGMADKERQQLKTPPMCQTSAAFLCPVQAIFSQSPPVPSVETDITSLLSVSHSQSLSGPSSYTHFAVPLSHLQTIATSSGLSSNYQAVFQSPPSMAYFVSGAPLAQSFGNTPPRTVASLPIIAQSPAMPFRDSLASSSPKSLTLGATSTPIVPILPSELNLSGASSYITVQNQLSLQIDSNQRNLQRTNENGSYTSGNTRPDSLSYEDLTRMSTRSLDGESFQSTQSTPTRGSTRSRPRSRIAAQFTNPPEPKE